MERPGDPQEVQLLKGQRRHFVPVTPLHFALRCFGGSLGLGETLGRAFGQPGGWAGAVTSWRALMWAGVGAACTTPVPPRSSAATLSHWAGAFELGGATVSSSLAGLGLLPSLGQSRRSGAGGHWGYPWEAGLPWLAGGSCLSSCPPKHCSGDGRT